MPIAGIASAAEPPSLLTSFGSFGNVQSIAADHVSGAVYVYDDGPGTIFKFNAYGEPEAFTPGGPDSIEGIGGASTAEVQLAVDNSSGTAQGNIYVANGNRISIFSAAGSPIGEISETVGAPWGEPCGVAVDDAGNVYVGLWGGGPEGAHVNEYSAAGGTPSDASYSASLYGLNNVCNIAVDSEGSVYADTYTGGPVMKYPASQFNTSEVSALGTLVDEHGYTLTVDPGTNHVYIDEGSRVAIYEATGLTPTLLGTIGENVLTESYGVAVDDGTGHTYVSIGDGGGIALYAVAPHVPPSILGESVTSATASTATLRGELASLSETHYYFEYGTDSLYGSYAPAGPPGEEHAASLRNISVAARITGLQPGTTYHYRLIAAGPYGVEEGTDHVFRTQNVVGPLTMLDDRAWEMVSPLEKNGANIAPIDDVPSGVANGGVVQAAADGEGITYTSAGAFAGSSQPKGAPLVNQYLAKREGAGWSTDNITEPLASRSYQPGTAGGPYKAFSTDLSHALMINGEKSNGAVLNAPLTENAPPGYQDYYLRNDLTSELQSVLTSTPSRAADEFKLTFEDASPSLEYSVFATSAALTANASDGGGGAKCGEQECNLYEYRDGGLELINLLPGDSTGTPGAVLGSALAGNRVGTNPVSSDGSTAYFSAQGVVYVREGIGTPQTKTVLVGGGEFQAASSDGSRAFIIAGGALYEFNRSREATTQLAAGVQGILGTSEDGSYVYFVSNDALSTGGSAGNCVSIAGESSQSCGLYLLHYDADTHQWEPARFIATLSGADNTGIHKDSGPEGAGAANDWWPEIAQRTARVSQDGSHVVFMSERSLTGYDNRDSLTGDPDQEVYVYDASRAGDLSCASCNPTDARPQGASSIPGGTQYATLQAVYQSRVLAGEGSRVFFDSGDALVPQDSNGVQDVYEWEEADPGRCAPCLGLISSGTSSSESWFVDASTSGDDVFFITAAQLVPHDSDSLIDLYDARAPHTPGEQVGTTPQASPPECSGTGCQGPPASTPIFATPPSVTATGLGNYTSSPPVSRAKHTTKKKKKKKKKTRRPVKATHKTSKAKRSVKKSPRTTHKSRRHSS